MAHSHSRLAATGSVVLGLIAIAAAALGLEGAMAAAPEKPAAAAEVMKAVRFHGFGKADALKYEEVPKPAAGKGELLVMVRAAGVNPVDAKIRSGMFRGMPGLK